MKLNRTTLRSVEILKLVSKCPEGITLDRICDILNLPKTSAYDIITTLAETGMVNVARGQKQVYTIGLTAYRIGVSYTNHMDVLGTIEPELKAFAREIGKTVFYGVLTGHEVVYLCKFEPENPIITTATVGTKNPVYCTSLGKAILAYTDEETRRQVVGRIHFRKKTPRTILSEEAFLAGSPDGICSGCQGGGRAYGVCRCSCLRQRGPCAGRNQCLQPFQTYGRLSRSGTGGKAESRRNFAASGIPGKIRKNKRLTR